jgi:hypothetical protein
MAYAYLNSTRHNPLDLADWFMFLPAFERLLGLYKLYYKLRLRCVVLRRNPTDLR